MKSIFFLSLVSFILVNCTDKKDNPTDANCSQSICTENFVILHIAIKDSSGEAVSLDSFEIIDKDTSEDITASLSTEYNLENGTFPLYSDQFVAENQNTQRTLVFKGFVNAIKIAESEFVVVTDCCHVSLHSEETEIVIN